jgi:hypothetical protein
MILDETGDDDGRPGAGAVYWEGAGPWRSGATRSDPGAGGATRVGQETGGGACERNAGPRNSAGSEGRSDARTANAAAAAFFGKGELLRGSGSKGTDEDGIHATPSAGPVWDPAASARILQEPSGSPP